MISCAQMLDVLIKQMVYLPKFEGMTEDDVETFCIFYNFMSLQCFFFLHRDVLYFLVFVVSTLDTFCVRFALFLFFSCIFICVLFFYIYFLFLFICTFFTFFIAFFVMFCSY